MSKDRRLPEGWDDEPDGWQDDEDRTPLDVLEEYRRARLALDHLAEHLSEEYPWDAGGISDRGLKAWDGADNEFRRIHERFVAHPAPAEDVIPEYGSPSLFEDQGWHISRVRLIGIREAEVDVDVEVAEGANQPEGLRFRFVRTQERWLIHSILHVDPGSGISIAARY